jgi:hypothetical protein
MRVDGTMVAVFTLDELKRAAQELERLENSYRMKSRLYLKGAPMPRGSARESYYKRKIRRLQKEISQIDAIVYDVPGDAAQRCSMLEHKRDDVVRGVILQLHTAIEDLLDVWLKSYLLGVPAEMRNKAARSRRMTRRGHSLFGRGRGNGTGPRTATTLCTGCGEYWNAAGARKGAVGSSERALRTLGDFWMEPVSSSLAGSCFSPLSIFRSANMLNTRIATAIMLSRGLRLGVWQRTIKMLALAERPNVRRRVAPLGAQREGKSYRLPLNKFLGQSRWRTPLLAGMVGTPMEWIK